MTRSTAHWLPVAALALLTAPAAQALEAAFSGFATLGWAQSDSAYPYQCYITQAGSLKRDSLLGAQADLKLLPRWSATLQLRLTSPADADQGLKLRPALAFVAWRPDDDWLVRAGRARVPLYLNYESLDVGVTSDMARLPYELYSAIPTTDFSGLFVSRSLAWGEHEFGIDMWAGQAESTLRTWKRDGLPPKVAPGAQFSTGNARTTGITFTGRGPVLEWRVGVYTVRSTPVTGVPLAVRYARVDMTPGVGWWQVDESMPGPGVPRVASIRNNGASLGLNGQLPGNWRVTLEAAKLQQRDIEVGADSSAGYIAVFKRVGAWTPYASLARQRSSRGLLDWRLRLTSAPTPATVPGAAGLNAAQRLAGESVYAADQRSTAVGLSYSLSPQAKLKAEWMRTRIGIASVHVDTPPGQPDASGLRLHTVSASLSVAF